MIHTLAHVKLFYAINRRLPKMIIFLRFLTFFFLTEKLCFLIFEILKIWKRLYKIVN